MLSRPLGTIRKHAKLPFAFVIVSLLMVIFWPAIKVTLKNSEAFKGLHLRYSKWRYDWRGPSDMGDGRNALQVIIESPMGVGEDASGAVYVSDREGFVWKIEPSGRTTVIAGTGMTTGPEGLPTGRTPAREVAFAAPEGLVVDRNGDILLADSLNHAILKIDRDGYLTRFAGSGSAGYSGDGKPALESSLSTPHDVRVDSKNNVYIADVFNHRIRRIDQKGIITTVAGTGVQGYSGDGGAAVNAQLNTPYGILLDKNDNLLIADSENHVIRKVTSDGIITTLAGSGQRGYDGDGGNARAAKFDSPQSLAIDWQNRIYIGDEHNSAIRVLEVDGTLRTLIGTKGPGFSGDGGPASMAQIADPENIWIRKDGSILISVGDNSRLRLVSPDGMISTFAGRGPTAKHDYFRPISIPSVEP